MFIWFNPLSVAAGVLIKWTTGKRVSCINPERPVGGQGNLSYGASYAHFRWVSLQIPLNQEKVSNNICYMQFKSKNLLEAHSLRLTIYRLFYWKTPNKPKWILSIVVEAWKNLLTAYILLIFQIKCGLCNIYISRLVW